MTKPVLHVVHTIDTEGPLDEDISATFKRIEELFGLNFPATHETLGRLQRREIPLGGLEEDVARVVSPQLLAYNRTWEDIRAMLEEALSDEFRNQMVDDFGQGWKYSWHCVDHLGFSDNPRRKDYGYGNVFRFYRNILEETGSERDEINWHFHPLSITRNAISAATSYSNSMDILNYVITRRIIDDCWFPTTNRPGFHAERPDAHAFLEQWIPFDYASQACKVDQQVQKDTQMGRFGDWSRAPETWMGYHPHHDDYQVTGACRRWIFRCLNLGTRMRILTEQHVHEAFGEARKYGSAIIAFADHDFRDIRPDVQRMREMLEAARGDNQDVRLRFSGAEEAAREHVAVITPEQASSPLEIGLEIDGERVHVRLLSGSLFGPQPFLALKSNAGDYYHDNLDVVIAGKHWTYVMDDQTLPRAALSAIGVGSAGRSGGYCVKVLAL